MNTSHIYPGANSVNVYLCLTNCVEAIEYYKKAFGATERGRLLMPDGNIAHAEIGIGNSLIMLAEENAQWGTKSPTTLGGSPITIAIYVEDADEVFKKAVEAGGTEVMPMKDEFYGDRIGQIMDPFGYKWMIGTHKEEVSFEEMQKRFNEMINQ
jgi:PhnB protein